MPVPERTAAVYSPRTFDGRVRLINAVPEPAAQCESVR